MYHTIQNWSAWQRDGWAPVVQLRMMTFWNVECYSFIQGMLLKPGTIVWCCKHTWLNTWTSEPSRQQVVPLTITPSDSLWEWELPILTLLALWFPEEHIPPGITVVRVPLSLGQFPLVIRASLYQESSRHKRAIAVEGIIDPDRWVAGRGTAI